VIEMYMVIIPIMMAISVAGIYWAVASYRQYKLNIQVSEELDVIIKSTIETVKKIKRSAGEGGRILSENKDIFTSAGMLSTLVTVLIHKFGDTRLAMDDFTFADDQYVTIYVDQATDEIILSLNKHLENVDYSLVNFKKVDDSTFH